MAGNNMTGNNKGSVCNMNDMRWFMLALVGIFVIWYMSSSSSCKPSNGRRNTRELMKAGMPSFAEPAPVTETQKSDPRHTNPSHCAMNNAVSANLLPKNGNVVSNDGFEFAPKIDIENMNFLDSHSIIGIDTKSSSLRNANVGLRADIPNPREDVSPWMKSTIEPDLTRRSLE